MSSVRSILWLLFLAVLLVAAHVAVSLGGGARHLVRRTQLLPKAAAATHIVVKRAGSPRTVVLRDDRWRLVEPYAGEADETAVMRLLDALATEPILNARTDAELLRLGRTRTDFGLDAPNLVVDLERADGFRAEVAFGTRTPSGDSVYAAVSDDDGGVFLLSTNVLGAVDVLADGLRLRALCNLDVTGVRSFGLRRGTSAETGFVRTGTGWSVGGATASSEKVMHFLKAVAGARAIGFVWPTGATNETEGVSASLLAGYGLDAENALALSVRADDGSEIRVSFGHDAAPGQVYALVQGGSAVVTVGTELRELAAHGISGFAEQRLFPLESAAVRSVAIADGDAAYAFARNADGSWVLVSPVAAPADSATVEAIIGRLLSLGAADRTTEGLQVSFGTNASPVTVSRESVFGAMRPEDLRSKTLLSVDPVEVRRLVSSGGSDSERPTAVVHDLGRKVWNVESGPADAKVLDAGVAAVLSALNPLVALRVEKLRVSAVELRDYGLDSPRFTLSVDRVRSDAVRRNVFIGFRATGGHYATVGTADAVFVLSDETVERLCAPLAGKQ